MIDRKKWPGNRSTTPPPNINAAGVVPMAAKGPTL